MAGSPESLDIDEVMREWLMALEYVARTMRKGTAESEQAPSDTTRVRDEVLEVGQPAAMGQ